MALFLSLRVFEKLNSLYMPDYPLYPPGCCSVAKLCLTPCNPNGLQHTRLPCPLPSPRACSNSCPSSRWCHPTISSSVISFSSCLQSFPASGSFPVSWLFTSGGQSIGASASLLPMNTQDWFPLGWTGWISLQSMGLLRVFQHHSLKASILRCSDFFIVQLSHPYVTTGKTIAFDYMALCQQSDVSAF